MSERETKTAVAEPPAPATVAAPAPEAAAPKANAVVAPPAEAAAILPTADGAAPPAPSRRRKLLFAIAVPLAAAIVFGVVTWRLSTVKHEAAPPEPPKTEEVVPPPSGLDAIDPSLTAGELLDLADAALARANWEWAEELLGEARARVGEKDVDLRVDVFAALAKAAEMGGKTGTAARYRHAIAELKDGVGGTLPLFVEAESLLSDGKLDEARRAFAVFLLRAGELKSNAEQYTQRARLHLVEIAARAARAVEPRSGDGIEPEWYFVR